MVAQVDPSGEVNCGISEKGMTKCEFWNLYRLMDVCGDCPLLKFGDKFVEETFAT